MINVQPTIVRRPVDENAALHPNEVLSRVLSARGVQLSDPADHRLRDLLHSENLSGLKQASKFIAEAISARRKITIVGDYDTDGATSTTLAITAIEACGAQSVDFLIPNRFDMGYGLGPDLVKIAASNGTDLIITVDNGISSISGIALAKQMGMQVVVTDHHLPGPQLPEADAIVNPNLANDAFPSKNMAGVAVIFYVMNAVCKHLDENDYFDDKGVNRPNPAEWLDLVALGTVADLVPMDRNNRILVEQGLRRMRAGKARPGINALLEVGKRKLETVVASDLGYAVAPRLNAAGRLDDMQRGVDCLRAPDPHTARMLAASLDELNLARREIESDMHSAALEAAEQLQHQLDGHPPAVMCLYDSDWHQGVCGIIAGRLKERYHRPALIFAKAEDGTLRGSARSIPGLHIRDVMANIDGNNPGLIEKFGGHAMAAGLTLREDALPQFTALIQQAVEAHFVDYPPSKELLTDGALKPEHFDLQLAKLLRFAAPWGQGFAEPSFDGKFLVQSDRIVGERHLKLTLAPLEKPNLSIDAIAFGQAEKLGMRQCAAVFRLDINHWRGRDSLQLIVEHIERL